MKLDLHRLRHAVTVAQTRSFSRAAEILAITQPALSRSIASLEEDLGLKIFDRGRSGVFITQAGAELVAGAGQLLTHAQTLEQSVTQLRNAESGVVNFGMAPLIASIFLPRLLARLAKASPNLVLRPVVRKAQMLLAALAEGEIDSCFIDGVVLPRQDHLIISPIGTVPIGLFARASHPLAQYPALPPEVLREFSFAASVAEFPDRLGGKPIVTGIVCDNYFLMKELILTSDTICLMSPLLLAEELRTGRVVRLNVALIDIDAFDLCAIRLANRTVSPSVRLVQETLVKLTQKGRGR